MAKKTVFGHIIVSFLGYLTASLNGGIQLLYIEINFNICNEH